MSKLPASPPLDAVLFDMDGVVTDTAEAHAAAWKRLFDDYLSRRAEQRGGDFEPFRLDSDYRRFVDGMPRYQGVRNFLDSRGIELPFGSPDDPPERETVCGLGNRKDRLFHQWLEGHGVRTYPGTLALLEDLRRHGLKAGLFTASRNAETVLRSAGVLDRFDARLDGAELARLELPGKPDPAMLVELAARLGVAPGRAAVLEDAVAGVQAGARGGFGFVVGIDRNDYGDQLASNGASIVVADAGELRVCSDRRLAPRTLRDIPGALDSWCEIEAWIGAAQPVLFLDYDGTLTGIVPDPDQAYLPAATRALVATLCEQIPVAIVSGRDLEKLRDFVALDSLFYAASHGFDIAGPGGFHQVPEGAEPYREALDEAQPALAAALENIPGCSIERKAFAIAVHYRRVADADVAALERAVDEVLVSFPRLRKTGGKKVFELRPDMHWDKGEVVAWLLQTLSPDADAARPIYIGDDVTDEDAFRKLRGRGVGIVVGDGAQRTSAGYRLTDTDEVAAFLERLAALLEARRT